MPQSIERSTLSSGLDWGLPTTSVTPAPLRQVARILDIGFIDFYSASPSLEGWLFCGWVGHPDNTAREVVAAFTAVFDRGEVEGEATLALFPREDLAGRGVGMAVHVDLDAPTDWSLVEVKVTLDGVVYTANGGEVSRKLTPPNLEEAFGQVVAARLEKGCGRETFSNLLSRVYRGQDTLGVLSDCLRMDIDLAIFCPPDGLVLIGWRLFAPGAIRRVRVRCGARAVEVRFDEALHMTRADVINAGVGADLGLDDPRCGFMAYVPASYVAGGDAYLEVETEDGRVAFRALRRSGMNALAGIKRMLGDADMRFDELDDAFDKVLGPAVASLNDERLARPVTVDVIDFGEAPAHPKCSVIVPLYGRIDFLDYQMALFSERPDRSDVEYIYVLDDPPKRRELENLAQSVFARFEIPFRLVLLSRNLGFAPANNHGLRHARGDYVCFLNSDAFPDTVDWIERLIVDLDTDPGIGVIGPRLLFEDGSIQHEGCFYRPLKEFGGWMYVDHDNRGRRPGADRGLRQVPAITGACMLMRRELAEDLGGFDEAFIIGDFEDSDLCKKILELGLSCAVDLDVTLYHLERKSQSGARERWRQNLTLYNAWVHQRRWYPEWRAEV
jgi:GT2 family glycosyltransferase